MIGVVVGTWGVPVVFDDSRKCPVVPVSAIAEVGDVSGAKPGGGGEGGETLCMYWGKVSIVVDVLAPQGTQLPWRQVGSPRVDPPIVLARVAPV